MVCRGKSKILKFTNQNFSIISTRLQYRILYWAHSRPLLKISTAKQLKQVAEQNYGFAIDTKKLLSSETRVASKPRSHNWLSDQQRQMKRSKEWLDWPPPWIQQQFLGWTEAFEPTFLLSCFHIFHSRRGFLKNKLWSEHIFQGKMQNKHRKNGKAVQCHN